MVWCVVFQDNAPYVGDLVYAEQRAMAVDYNLVVIGGSDAGIEAAKLAASAYARVALVRQGEGWDGLASCLLFLRSLADRIPTLQDLFQADGRVDWCKASQYWQLLAQQQQVQYCDDRLMALGIDVISTTGSFVRKPRVGFWVDDRLLTANSYLLALSDANPLAMFPQSLEKLQDVQKVGIVGDSSEAVAIAQALVKLGFSVYLTIPPVFLAGFDSTLVRLFKVQLEVDGVQFVPELHESEYDLVLPSTKSTDSNLPLKSLNLAAVGVSWRQIIANPQTRRAKNRYAYVRCVIHICGNSIPIAQNTVYHALQFRNQLPSTATPTRYLISQPSLVAIGLTEEAAQNGGQKIRVVERSLQPNLKAQLQGRSSGLCRLVVNRRGELVGAHVLGDEAEEWAAVLVLAVARRVRLTELGQLCWALPSLAAIVGEMAREGRPSRSRWRQYALEEFLSWQRYWGR
jgi:pyruvate/2-oxoglutarate dehydrogenase complex dihydrolipoamide dehydrogenase (E3) component